MAEATEVAVRLARGPSAAHGVTKQALNEEAAMDLVSAIECEAQAQAECMRNPELPRGLRGLPRQARAQFE